MDFKGPATLFTTVQTLFLDFDGVLHPEFCHESKHFMHRDSFEAVIHVLPKVDLVISSIRRLTRHNVQTAPKAQHSVALRQTDKVFVPGASS